jgi:hypothetical protein
MGFVVLVFILLAVGSFAAFGYYGIPVVIVGLIALGVLFANRAKRAAEGSPAGKGTPQDSSGGPTHKREDYAHTGQAYMTPDQMKRAR